MGTVSRTLLPRLGVAVLLLAALALLLTLSPADRASGETTSSHDHNGATTTIEVTTTAGETTTSDGGETTTTAEETTTTEQETTTTVADTTSTTKHGNGHGTTTSMPSSGSGRIHWMGNGADQIPEDCDTIKYHFVLTPGGPLDIQSATLHASFAGSGDVSVSAYKITGGAAHFSVTGTGELMSASADFTFTGKMTGHMVLTISDAKCVEVTTTTVKQTTTTLGQETTTTTEKQTTTTEAATTTTEAETTTTTLAEETTTTSEQETTTTTDQETTTTTEAGTTTTVAGETSTTSTTEGETTTTTAGQTTTTLAGVSSTTSTTSTTLAGVATTTQTPTRIEAGGGATADMISGWRLLALLGAVAAALLALAAAPLPRRH